MGSDQVPGRPLQDSRAAKGLAVCILAVAVFLHVWKLNNLPGINGDEAWGGVQMQLLARGQLHALQTPSGIWYSPLGPGLLLLLQYFFKPDFWLLRVPQVCFSLLAVFLLWRQGDHNSRALALLLACLPVAVMYARFGQDPSMNILMGVAILLSIRASHLWLALGLFMLAMLVHPTNIFLLPFALIPVLYARRGNQAQLLVYLAIATVVALLVLWLFVPSSLPFTREDISDRLLSPILAWEFCAMLGRFMTGVATYEYIVGQLEPAVILPHLVVFCTLMALAILGCIVEKDLRIRFISWLIMLLCFYIVAGPESLSPHLDRYGLVLVVPTLWIMVEGISALEQRIHKQALLTTIIFSVCIASLADTYVQYFHRLATTGGSSHRTFRTAAEEPKQQAIETIARENRCPMATILAEDWWLYWPMRYLSASYPGLTVLMWAEGASESVTPGRGCVYLVGFAHGPIQSSLMASHRWLARRTITDPAGAPILYIWREQ